MQVQVWSDVVCPWCYIGKRRLEAALEQWHAEGGEPVEVVWRPFQLDPAAPNDGASTAEVLAGKYGGGAGRAAQMMGQVTAVAAEAGLEYRLDRSLRANTRDAHVLLAAALEQGGPALQDALAEELFRAYFTDGADLGDRAVLVDRAAAAGLADPRGALADTALADRVGAELAEGLAIGVTSVPTFVVGEHGIAGAQEPEAILALLRAGAGQPVRG